MSDAIFTPQGDLFLPTPLARGPWSPDALHGGAPGALLARAVERFDDGERMLVARCTALRMRRHAVPVPDGLPSLAPPPAPGTGADSPSP